MWTNNPVHPIYLKKKRLLQAYEFQSGYFQDLDVFACLLFLFLQNRKHAITTQW